MTGLLVLLPFVALLVAAPVLLVVLAVTAFPDGALVPATAAARRHAVTGGALAVVAGAAVLLPAVVVGTDAAAGTPDDRLLALAPALAALAHTAVLALTEVTWPRPGGARRTGRLEHRSARTVAPRRWRAAVHVAAGTLVAVALAGLALGDDTGRSFTVTFLVLPGGEGLASSTAGPFPGATFTPALLAAAVLVVLAAEAALRLVVARPAVAGADPATDAALRRAGAHRVLRGALSGLLLTLGPVLFVAGVAMLNAGEGTAWRALGFAGFALGAACGVAALAVLCVPAARVPAPAAPAPAAGRPGDGGAARRV